MSGRVTFDNPRLCFEKLRDFFDENIIIGQEMVKDFTATLDSYRTDPIYFGLNLPRIAHRLKSMVDEISHYRNYFVCPILDDIILAERKETEIKQCKTGQQ